MKFCMRVLFNDQTLILYGFQMTCNFAEEDKHKT